MFIRSMQRTGKSVQLVSHCIRFRSKKAMPLKATNKILQAQGTSAGVGFAISAAAVARAVPQLIQFGKVTRPSLRIQVA